MKLFVGLLTVLLALNCSDNGTDDKPNCLDTICTEEYRTITISVKDKDGVAMESTLCSVISMFQNTETRNLK